MISGSGSTVERTNGPLVCVRCGYELRGLRAGANCPECGTPIEESERNLLRSADPHWLATLHLGMKIAHVGMQCLFILIIVFFVVMILGLLATPLTRVPGRQPEPGTFELAMNLMLGVVITGIAIAFILSGIGNWIMSAPEPREADNDSASVPYRILSALMVPVLALWYYLVGAQPLVSAHWTLQQVAVHLFFALTIWHSLLLARWAHRLERRLPKAISRPFKAAPWRLPWLVAVAGTLIVLYWIASTIETIGPPNRPWQPPGETAQAVLFLVTVIIWLSLVAHALQLRPHIASERREGGRKTEAGTG